jgi:DNA-binding HxlR family transcriptional regulator
MSWDTVCESVCPIARSLSVVGDRWTLLIMREISLGVRRFDDLQAQTEMSSFLLSTRLKAMENEGVLERRLYCERPKRYEYHATQKGKELDAVLLALRSWGMKWGGFDPLDEPAVKLVSKRTGEEINASWSPAVQDMPFTFDAVESTISAEFIAERQARDTQFRASKRSAKNTTTTKE